MKETDELKNSEKDLILVVEDFDYLNNYIAKNLRKRLRSGSVSHGKTGLQGTSE